MEAAGASGLTDKDIDAGLEAWRSEPGVLLAYSEGRMSRRQAMQALGLEPERQADFVEAMIKRGIPWPEADPAQIDREAEIVAASIREAYDEG